MVAAGVIQALVVNCCNPVTPAWCFNLILTILKINESADWFVWTLSYVRPILLVHSSDNILFQPPPGDPVWPMRGPVDQARRAVQRKNLQGNFDPLVNICI